METHIDDDKLELYTMGGLEEDEATKLEGHLAVCESCCARLADADRFISVLRAAIGRVPRPQVHATSGQKRAADKNVAKLLSALIDDLAYQLPDLPRLESVQADLLQAGKQLESGDTLDVVLRFYLTFRSLLSELERARKTQGA